MYRDIFLPNGSLHVGDLFRSVGSLKHLDVVASYGSHFANININVNEAIVKCQKDRIFYFCEEGQNAEKNISVI